MRIRPGCAESGPLQCKERAARGQRSWRLMHARDRCANPPFRRSKIPPQQTGSQRSLTQEFVSHYDSSCFPGTRLQASFRCSGIQCVVTVDNTSLVRITRPDLLAISTSALSPTHSSNHKSSSGTLSSYANPTFDERRDENTIVQHRYPRDAQFSNRFPHLAPCFKKRCAASRIMAQPISVSTAAWLHSSLSPAPRRMIPRRI